MSESDEKMLKETESIKKLLMLLLAKLGSDSKEISMALGIDSSSVRRMIQISKVNKILD